MQAKQTFKQTLGEVPALSSNIRLGWKCSNLTNALAYWSRVELHNIKPWVNLIKLFGVNLLTLFGSYIFSQDRKIMVTLINWSSLKKCEKIYVKKVLCDWPPGKRRQNGLTSLSHPRINIIRCFGYATYFIKHFVHFLCFYMVFICTVLALLHTLWLFIVYIFHFYVCHT